jgi:hypothetical protein
VGLCVPTHIAVLTSVGVVCVGHCLQVTEKCSRDVAKSPEEDVRKYTFFLSESKIRLDFHYGDERVTHSCRIYTKDSSDATGWCVDPLAKQPSRMALRGEFQEVVAREKEVVSKVREHERMAYDLLLQVRREMVDVALQKSVYDVARDKSQEEDRDTHAAEDEDEEKVVDVLHAFLQQFGAQVCHTDVYMCKFHLTDRLMG